MNQITHPTPENIRIVANRLESMMPECRYGDVDMSVGDIHRNDNECGTVACHAGFYELEHALRNKDSYFFYDDDARCHSYIYLHERRNNDTNTDCMVSWHDGANRMANDLGFITKEDLEIWAATNPELWGNDCGHAMFQNRYAFKQEGRILKLADIITQWRNVADRIEKLNLQQ